LHFLRVRKNSSFSFNYLFFNFRKERLANSEHHITTFGSSTGLSNVRRHLFNNHIADWVKACEDQKIQIRGADAKRAVQRFRNLPEATQLEADRPEFSKENFVDAIAEFVVGDDQVCKNN
jgi:hypothetical protein